MNAESKRHGLLRTLCIRWLRKHEPEILAQLREESERRVPPNGKYEHKPGPKVKERGHK